MFDLFHPFQAAAVFICHEFSFSDTDTVFPRGGTTRSKGSGYHPLDDTIYLFPLFFVIFSPCQVQVQISIPRMAKEVPGDTGFSQLLPGNGDHFLISGYWNAHIQNQNITPGMRPDDHLSQFMSGFKKAIPISPSEALLKFNTAGIPADISRHLQHIAQLVLSRTMKFDKKRG